MDKEAGHAAVHGVAKSQTQLSDCTDYYSKGCPKLRGKPRGRVKSVQGRIFSISVNTLEHRIGFAVFLL